MRFERDFKSVFHRNVLELLDRAPPAAASRLDDVESLGNCVAVEQDVEHPLARLILIGLGKVEANGIGGRSETG